MIHRYDESAAGTDRCVDVRHPDCLAGVVAVLWDEQQVLDEVAYRLVQEQRVITSGSTRWLARADDDLRAALDRLASIEILRAIEVGAVALGPAERSCATLHDLCELAHDPTSTMLTSLRDSLRELVGEIEAAATTTGRLLDVGLADARQTLARVDTIASPQLATTQVALHAARATLERVRQRSLLEFLA